jgi:arginase family enzyme
LEAESPAEAIATATVAAPPAAGLDPAEMRAIFERVAREEIQRLVGELAPRLVAEAVEREIAALKAQAFGGKPSDDNGSVVD